MKRLVPETKIMLDRERTLRMDFNALAEIEEVLGVDTLTDNVFTAKGMSSFKNLRAIVYGCLKHEDPELTLQQAGALISLQDAEVFGQALTELFDASVGKGESGSGNAAGKK